MTHELKTIQPYFDQVVSGEKKFELRLNDRGFKVGDTLRLVEFTPFSEADPILLGRYTSQRIEKKVTYILRDKPQFGLAAGYCIMGIE